MFTNITASETGSNNGSCGALVQYLEKENLNAFKEEKAKELWFNGTRSDIIPQEVRVTIDNNIAKLGKEDAKFFLVNISPSQKEIAFLKEKFGEQGAAEQLKEFAKKVMDAYAQNFKRSGIETNNDLLWYGKLEHYRYYNSHDQEVKEGIKKAGERKEGEQMHVQVIVSRKDITNKIKLSPMNNSRGKNREHSAKLGQFDRRAFKESGEILFDKVFDFDRQIRDTMAYALTMKKGSGEQKRMLHALEQAEGGAKGKDKSAFLDTAREIFQGERQEEHHDQHKDHAHLLEKGSTPLSGLLNILLTPDPINEPQNNPSLDPKKKKKKDHSRGQSH